MKRAAVLLFALTSVFSVASQAANDTIRLGVDATFPPLEFKQPDGSLSGFEIDLGNAVCAEIQKKCKWVPQTFDGLFPSLKARKIDAIFSSLGITEKRKKQVLFTDVVWTGYSSMLSRKGDHLEPTVKSLKGKIIGVQQGTMQETYAKARFAKKGVEVRSYQDQDLVYSDLLNGRIDVSFQDMLQAQMNFIRDGKHNNFNNQKVVDELLQADSAIAVGKDNQSLVQLLNKGLKKTHEDGTYEKIKQKYFGDLSIYQQ